jgi:uncharacterized protein YbbK (DUF523 family)
MKKILVSACLYGGEIVRYDGGDTTCLDPIFLKWKEEGRLISVCPEVFGGLPTPRPDSQRIGEKVMTGAGVDVTAAYTKGALEAKRLAEEHAVAFAIMKAHSPSCGSKMIYDGTFTDNIVAGQGMATEMVRNAGFKVFNEDDLEEAQAYLDALEK